MHIIFHYKCDIFVSIHSYNDDLNFIYKHNINNYLNLFYYSNNIFHSYLRLFFYCWTLWDVVDFHLTRVDFHPNFGRGRLFGRDGWWYPTTITTTTTTTWGRNEIQPTQTGSVNIFPWYRLWPQSSHVQCKNILVRT